MSECGTIKTERLAELCGRVNDLLIEAISLTHKIVGVPINKEGEPEKEPSTAIEVLHSELKVAHVRAQTLLDQLNHIADRI